LHVFVLYAGAAEEDIAMPAAIDDSNLIDQSGRGAADSTVRVQQHTRPGAAEQANGSGRTVGQQSVVPAAAAHAMTEELATAAGAAQAGSYHATEQVGQPGSSNIGHAAAGSQFSTAAVAAAAERAAAAAANASAAGYPGAAAAATAAADTAGAAYARWSAVLSLIWHPSDSAVKPIVANRRIERLPDLTWDAKSLPFEPLSLQQMLNCDQGELEAFLTHIYRTIASSAPVKDKVNVLSYFESLCSDTNAANVLINSSLTVLFVRMLRNGKTPLLRIRLASVLGLLVRHATYIADELAGTQLVEILTEALRDKSERVRRRYAGSSFCCA
jgi:serine/threonine-protein kinase ULK4